MLLDTVFNEQSPSTHIHGPRSTLPSGPDSVPLPNIYRIRVRRASSPGRQRVLVRFRLLLRAQRPPCRVSGGTNFQSRRNQRERVLRAPRRPSQCHGRLRPREHVPEGIHQGTAEQRGGNFLRGRIDDVCAGLPDRVLVP